MTALERVLGALQAPSDMVVVLPRDGGLLTDRTADYSDLLGELTPVEAVIECDRAPLAYIVLIRPDGGGDIRNAQALTTRLANRSASAALLSVDESLRAHLWRCRFLQQQPVAEFDLTNPDQAASLLLTLQEGLTLEAKEKAQEFELRELLKDSVRRVALALQNAGVAASTEADDVLALVGRAVFARFLLDRGILSAASAPELFATIEGSIEHAFEADGDAARLCRWLDQTFNGELLTLSTQGKSYEDYFARLRQVAGADALTPLTWIMGRTLAGGQLPLWECLDFAHIPAGVLSEVYEDFARFRFPAKAKAESIHYTPRHIARVVVSQAMHGVPVELRGRAHVLDPAVGAGIFLCLAFRELAKCDYRTTGVWPDTRRLRAMLYEQLCGFDINDDALKLAALSLYLSAIELDPSPLPPEKLHFEWPLVGTVLYNTRTEPNESDEDAELGSLRQRLPGERQRFDIVLGNPPWTSLTGKTAKRLDRQTSSLAQRVAAERGIVFPYNNPDHVPDLPFVWKCADLAKPNGVIALVLHGRLLTKASDQARQAREAIFRTFAVQGIVNGGELVEKMEWWWPTVAVPFCILFARNKRPSPTHTFTILTPKLASAAERRPHLRLDQSLVQQYDLGGLIGDPDLPIVLGKASALDAALIRKIKRRSQAESEKAKRSRQASLPRYVRLGAYLAEVPGLIRGRGYKEGDKSKAVDWNVDWSRVAEITHTDDLQINADVLFEFHRRPMERSRSEEQYRLPLLLLRESPGEFESRGGALLIASEAGQRSHCVFPGSFHGVVLAGHPQGELLGKYLALLLSSIYAYYFYLLTTGFAERRRLLDIELDSLPVVALDDALSNDVTSAAEIEGLFASLRGQARANDELDSWIRRVMSLNDGDLRIMRETISVSSPFQSSRELALAPVTARQLHQFCASLRNGLVSHMGLEDSAISVVPVQTAKVPGWEFVACSRGDALSRKVNISAVWLSSLALQAYPASQVVEGVDEVVVLGRPRDHIHWLPSRASLLVVELSRHLNAA